MKRDPAKARAKASKKEAKIEVRQQRTATAAAALSAFTQGMAEGSGSQSTTSTAQSYPGGSLTALLLYADDNERTFLGCLNCSEYDQNSVWNEYGPYGSKYSSTSIRNAYSQFGSKYSAISACNDYASEPPFILDEGGNYYGRLTVNAYAPDANQNDTVRRLVRLLCLH